MAEYVDWIRFITEGLKQPSKSQVGLANALGRSPSAITNLLKGERQLKAHEIPIVLRYFDVEPEQPAVPAAPNPSAAPGPRIPVYAGAISPTGIVTLSPGVMEFIEAPPLLRDVPGAYAMLISGDTMVPAYRSGDIVFLHPRRPTERDTDVVVFDRDLKIPGARAMIRRLVGIADKTLRLEQFRPPKVTVEQRTEWPIVNQIVGKYSGRG